ncbi:DUF350 domain-containing protein [Sutcliffiella halmapala]|uniref:DUF350 domain-containing protein n=1 Tax=Sutcliffiella halmapala TaxID=79882 RepID=UPI000995C6C1|nr:DUF350 domain-containing protein [Sutcliffiella halmapala]
MSSFWENELVRTTANYSVVVLCLILFLAILELVTKYKNMEEIKKGNLAVALATGGKILGIANIFRYSISDHATFLTMIGWGALGFIFLLLGYFIFEFLTPNFNVDDEIRNDNRAVGFISFVISVGLSYIIGASIG